MECKDDAEVEVGSRVSDHVEGVHVPLAHRAWAGVVLDLRWSRSLGTPGRVYPPNRTEYTHLRVPHDAIIQREVAFMHDSLLENVEAIAGELITRRANDSGGWHQLARGCWCTVQGTGWPVEASRKHHVGFRSEYLEVLLDRDDEVFWDWAAKPSWGECLLPQGGIVTGELRYNSNL